MSPFLRLQVEGPDRELNRMTCEPALLRNLDPLRLVLN